MSDIFSDSDDNNDNNDNNHDDSDDNEKPYDEDSDDDENDNNDNDNNDNDNNDNDKSNKDDNNTEDNIMIFDDDESDNEEKEDEKDEKEDDYTAIGNKTRSKVWKKENKKTPAEKKKIKVAKDNKEPKGAMSSSEWRSKGRQTISIIPKSEKSTIIIEKAVMNSAIKQIKLSGGKAVNSNIKLWDAYYTTIIEVVFDIRNGESTKDTLAALKCGSYLHDHAKLKYVRTDRDAYDEMMNKPLEVAEGVEKCRKCPSWKVYSYQLQIRGGDEGVTTFCTCSECGAKWSFS
jgi:DNA-directed RNA polymerase subunit M/transcription elongation factor TFIIS